MSTTTENLQQAFAGESHEYTKMYPPMLEQANVAPLLQRHKIQVTSPSSLTTKGRRPNSG
jgi:rubrerythrin